MAWNQPSGQGGPGNQNNPWGRRPGQGGLNLEERLRSWRRKLSAMLPPGSGGRRRMVLWGAAAALALWAASGVYEVGPAEQGVVLRFGRFTQLMPPGLHYHVPWPIESVDKINVGGVKFSSLKARVLTSDVNLAELHLAVHYQITDPIKALFGVREPERTLADVSESVIREVVGRSTLDEVLVGGTRPQITRRAQELIQRTLDAYGTGITLTSVNLVDVQVPDAVVDAQHDANKALAEQDRSIKAAQADANSIVPQAKGEAAGIEQQAQAYRTQVLKDAQARATSFSQILDAYNEAPAVTRRRLYLETIESVLIHAHKVVIDATGGRGGSSNLIYLPLDKLLERSGAHEVQIPSEPHPQAHKEPESPSVEAPRARGER